MKLHLISINQDWEDAKNGLDISDDEYFESDSYYQGAVDTMEHLLSVATDIMNANE
jgi:hypothetical protein